jgi:assimilatory nitrate reductase catalytic subunit
MAHEPGPYLAIHPRDADVYGIKTDGLVRIENARGSLVLRAVTTEAQRRGEVFAPMHWTDEFSSAGAVARLVHDETDPISGQPDLKGSKVRVCAVETLWTGSLLRRASTPPDLGDSVYWSKVPVDSGFAFDLVGWVDLASLIHSERVLRRLLQIQAEAELVSYSDPRKSIFRYAGLLDGRLDACLSLAPSAAGLLARETVAPFLGRTLDPAERLALLAGHRAGVSASPDKIVCACFSVGADSLAAAIRRKSFTSVHEVGVALGAGTRCGSCIPELKKMLTDTASERGLLQATP